MASKKCDQFVSPSIADRRWKERVDSSEKPHPFKPSDRSLDAKTFTPADRTTYNSNFGTNSKQDYCNRTLLADSVPPAGRSSFHRETLRDEIVNLANDKVYQDILVNHMRSKQSEHLKTFTEP